MIFRRLFSFSSSGFWLMGILFIGEAVVLAQRVRAGKKAELRLHELRRELRSLTATVPGPTSENSRAIETDLTRAATVVSALESELAGQERGGERWSKTGVPAKRTDAFFDLAALVEKLRAQAANAGVVLKPDERFGFSAYANEGPDPSVIPAVFRQRRTVDYLADALFGAHPRQLLGVERERPISSAVSAGTGGLADPPSPGTFRIDPRASLRKAGMIETQAFRVVFVGQTADLRGFLARLGDFELPLVVREIEVEPAGTSELKPANSVPERPSRISTALADPLAPAEEATPVVLPLWLKFSVTVESLEILPAKNGEKIENGLNRRPAT